MITSASDSIPVKKNASYPCWFQCQWPSFLSSKSHHPQK